MEIPDMNKTLASLPVSPEGHWDKRHHTIITYIRDVVNPKTCLEIGLNSGYSTVMWLCSLPELQLHSVDIGIHIFVPDVQERLTKLFGSRFTYETLDSTKLHDKKYPMYDLVIIDGCHKHDICYSDLLFAVQHAKFILLDDTGGNSPGVTSARAQFIKEHPDVLQLVKHWTIRSGSMLYKNEPEKLEIITNTESLEK